MSPFMAEFIGTFLLILLGEGVVANVLLKDTKGNNSGLMVIATAWGLAVFVGVIVAGPISGAHLNPAVTIGLAIAGKFAWASVLPYIIAQFAGAFFGAVTVWVFHYYLNAVSFLCHCYLFTFFTFNCRPSTYDFRIKTFDFRLKQ